MLSEVFFFIDFSEIFVIIYCVERRLIELKIFALLLLNFVDFFLLAYNVVGSTVFKSIVYSTIITFIVAILIGMENMRLKRSAR